jgi:hypothetical protein
MVPYIMLIVFAIIVLHLPDGREVDINPIEIVSLREMPEDSNHVAKSSHCLINTTDGKFSTVIETCAEIRQMIEGH